MYAPFCLSIFVINKRLQATSRVAGKHAGLSSCVMPTKELVVDISGTKAAHRTSLAESGRFMNEKSSKLLVKSGDERI